MEKDAATTGDILKWLLGAALVGGGARAAFGLGRKVLPREHTMESAEDIIDESVAVPVDVTPEQYEEYQRRRKALGLNKAAGEKVAGEWWDPMAYTLAGVGGLGLGWVVASQIMKRIRNARLNAELRRVRKELSDLTGTPPQLPESEATEEDLEKAAAYDWLDMIAEEATSQTEKTARFGPIGGFRRLLTKPGLRSFAAKLHPGKRLAATGLITAGSLPLLWAGRELYRSYTRPGYAEGRVPAAVSFFGEPLLQLLGATVGPIAALVGLHALTKGYRSARSTSEEQAKLKEFRRHIRRQEARLTPHVRLVPRVMAQREKEEEEERDPNRLGLNVTYGKAAVDRAIAKYAQVMNALPPSGVAPPMVGDLTPKEQEDDAILPEVQDEETIQPPSDELRAQVAQSPEGMQAQMENMPPGLPGPMMPGVPPGMMPPVGAGMGAGAGAAGGAAAGMGAMPPAPMTP